jgi:hypothetical protein
VNPARVTHCAVCRQPQTSPDGWYQLIENRWTDRLKILRFHESLSAQPNAHSVCCPAHVRELVVHWMTIGRLDVPFARVPSRPRGFFFRRSPKQNREVHELPVSPGVLLGELAVHRESLTRILRENPEALSAVLENLIHALEGDADQRPAVATAAVRLTLAESLALS